MKRFVINVVLVVLPICLIVSLFNLIVDPGHLYGNGGYEKQLAKMLVLSKQNVTNVNKNISERNLKMNSRKHTFPTMLKLMKSTLKA